LLAIPRPDQAIAVVEALASGGLTCVEVAFRTRNAERVVEAVAKAFPHLTVAAGTVLSIEQTKIAHESGAAFVVSPAYNPEVVEFAVEHRIAILPGVATPTELDRAMQDGLSVVKLFPIAQLGGPAYIRALAGPYPTMLYVPTGGVTKEDAHAYLETPQVVAVAGSWLVPRSALDSNDLEPVRARAGEAAALVARLHS
jgi:2-dehydro-3-deoxyphosphogluconate aldolase/(4S)-4-hydroxy-2-oxoglutarate aldolase